MNSTKKFSYVIIMCTILLVVFIIFNLPKLIGLYAMSLGPPPIGSEDLAHLQELKEYVEEAKQFVLNFETELYKLKAFSEANKDIEYTIYNENPLRIIIHQRTQTDAPTHMKLEPEALDGIDYFTPEITDILNSFLSQMHENGFIRVANGRVCVRYVVSPKNSLIFLDIFDDTNISPLIFDSLDVSPPIDEADHYREYVSGMWVVEVSHGYVR